MYFAPARASASLSVSFTPTPASIAGPSVTIVRSAIFLPPLDDAATCIAGTLVAHATKAESERIIRRAPTDPTDYHLYLRHWMSSGCGTSTMPPSRRAIYAKPLNSIRNWARACCPFSLPRWRTGRWPGSCAGSNWMPPSRSADRPVRLITHSRLGARLKAGRCITCGVLATRPGGGSWFGGCRCHCD